MLPLLLQLMLAVQEPVADPTYTSAVADLNTAIEQAGDRTPDESIAAIEAAIDKLTRFHVELSGDSDTLLRLTEARLASVALLLAKGDEAQAQIVMDAALRAARGNALPAGAFGPAVFQLYEDRLGALRARGTGTIEVDCRVPCQVLVDERRAANPTEPLLLGDYRVWVGSRDGSADWESHSVSLDRADQTQHLIYPAEFGSSSALAPSTGPSTGETTPVEPSDRRPVGQKTGRKRMLPRWSELVALAAGVGLTISGVVLLSQDGKCRDGSDDLLACQYTWENTVPGYALLGTGLGVLTLSGVLLTVDEVRVGRTKGQQVMVHWTLKF